MAAFNLDGCELGVATAPTQIEGGHAQTNWHRWADLGKILDGSSPARANDHWNRVDSDIALLAELGVKHYRMGFEWARLEPSPGTFDAEAIAHYRHELSALRAAGIKPLVTLHHFNNPVWFEDVGGFLYPNASSVFQRYVHRMVTEFGDLVDEWITINEPNIYGVHAYFFGEWPPGEKDLRITLRAFESMAVAHIDAYQLIHRLQPHARVGVAQHLRVFVPKLRFHPRHASASLLSEWLFQGAIGHALSQGRFRFPLMQPRGVRRGKYYDFQGLNYYSRSTVTSLKDAYAEDADVNDLGWEIYPKGLITLAGRLHREYPGVPIYVTENGTADAADTFRCRFLYDQLRLIAESPLPIERYYHWTFIDNWEWLGGEMPKFGLVANNYETQERTVKRSGRFYAEIIRDRGVTQDSYDRYVAAQAYTRVGSKHAAAAAVGGFWG